MSLSIKVSVVIVTYNRHEDCKHTIKSLLVQSVQPHEIIVIDDHSVIPFRYNHHLVKIVRNDRELGLSGSRNVGIRSSSGDVITFIDDDALATQDWVETICQTFRGDVDVIGGSVLPLYIKRPPRWWSRAKFGMSVGISAGRRRVIMGCNFAVRSFVFDRVGYFDVRLGRKYGTLLSGEEDEFFQRASKMGAKIRFVPRMKVYHKVYAYRLTMLYLLRRVWWQGVTNYLANSVTYRTVLRRMGRLVSSFLRILLFPRNSRKWILKCVRNFGFLFAMFRFKRSQEISAHSG